MRSYSSGLSSLFHHRILSRFRHTLSSQPPAEFITPMATTEDSLRRALADKQSTIDARGSAIRQLKSSGASKADIDDAVKALNALKLEKTSIENQLKASISGDDNGSVISRDAFRQAVVNTLERRLFYIPSFKIYRGVAGLYDFGPPGCAVKSNVLAFWRQHFVLEEDMLEVDCPCVTPEVVLKASGHVDKFTDLMVKDEKTGTCYRADHLLKDYCKDKLEKDLGISTEKAAELKHILAVLDDLSAEQLGAKIKEYGITAPDTKNPLSDPYPFNLMFQTSIGPSGVSTGYMRPETAQGIFVNFKDLYYYNGNKLPFAAAQIGQAFRNEISPRQGLLRVREFTLAEIEHFVDPDDKSHPKYSEVANLEFLMFPRDEQMSGQSAKRLCLGEAVSKGIVNNQTLAYFIGRVYLFLTRLGIDEERLRFRQHLPNEMAHYAADCWDAEIESSYGWIECVGIADRSAYDLRAHTDKSGVALVAQEKFAEPREVEKLVITPIKKELGLAFKGNQKMVVEAMERGDEGRLTEKFATTMQNVLSDDVRYLHFDFHKICGHVHFERLSILYDQIEDFLIKNRYYLLNDKGEKVETQIGIVRTNCVDCLDRTNVTQSMIGRKMLEFQLQRLGLFDAEESISTHPNFDDCFKILWANHGDDISIQYSGTPALKGDFVRVDRRTIKGMFKDGWNALMRYYLFCTMQID